MVGGIVGWSGLSQSTATGGAALTAMLDASAPADRSSCAGAIEVRLGATHALARSVAGARRLSGGCGDRAAWCAIDGHPRWSEGRLADLARREGDEAALADGFARYGSDVVRWLGGRYRLAVVEPRRAFLAVDRVATLPWYVASPEQGVLVFASSLEGLLAHPMVTRSLSAQAIAEYFLFDVLHGGRTVYHGVERLQAAECLIFDGERLTRHEHSRVAYAPPRRCSPGKERELREEMWRVLREAVRREVADAPGAVGAFLSGGLDSSTIVGIATEALGRPVETFTVRFDVPGFDESAYATIAARRFGAHEHVYTLTPDDMVADLERVAVIFDEPFGNSSAAGSYHCAELAREAGVQTMLTGDGGDELFAGGDLYVLMQRFEFFSRLPARVRWATERVLELPGLSTMPWLRRARSYVRRAKIPMPSRALSYEYLSPATWSEVFEPEFIEAIDGAAATTILERVYAPPADADSLQRHLRFALHTATADDDLPKVQRTCAWHGIEARFPLLADDVLAFVAGVPSNVLVKHLHERAFYREVLRGYLPGAIMRKRKHCFAHPLGEWLSASTALRDVVVPVLRSFARRGIVRSDLIERLVADPSLVRSADLTRLVWCMAVLERWLATRGLQHWS